MRLLVNSSFSPHSRFVVVFEDGKSGGAASAATAVIRRKMDVGEAYQVLNLERNSSQVAVEEV